MHNLVFAQNTKNEESDERSVLIGHSYLRRRNDAVVSHKDDGYERGLMKNYLGKKHR